MRKNTKIALLTGTFIALMLTLTGLAAPASATKPVRTETGRFKSVFAFDVCSFPMTATLVGSTHTTTFVDAAGNPTGSISTGPLKVTLTRDDTGFSRRFSIGGKSILDADGNLVAGRGRWITEMVGVGWVLATGHLTMDGFGVVTVMKGHATPICDVMG